MYNGVNVLMGHESATGFIDKRGRMLMNIRDFEKNFTKLNYAVHYFEKSLDAVDYLCSKIKGKTVGFGDSQTLISMNLFEKLSSENSVFDPQNTVSDSGFIKTAMKCLTTEIYITSVNAFAFTGELVNIDGTGNRIAGSLFGHEKVYFVVGLNKGESTLEHAIWRARNIAAPKNAKRLGVKTPCAIKGDKCYNCSSTERICNALTVYYRALNNVQSEIIFINENLGY